MVERVKRKGIKNMRPAIIFALIPTGCSRKYTSLSRMRTHIYVKKIFLFNFGMEEVMTVISPETTFVHYVREKSFPVSHL